MKRKKLISILCVQLLLIALIFPVTVFSQLCTISDDPPEIYAEDELQGITRGGIGVILGSNLIVDGDGYMVAGQLWDSIKPANSLFRSPGEEEDWTRYLVNLGASHGNNWTEPVHTWPGGFTRTLFWRNGKRVMGTVFSTNPNFNPEEINGETNRAYNAESGTQYAYMYYSPNVPGANDINRNYRRDAYWEDPEHRSLKIYEAGFPTNLGIDVRIKARQYARNFAGLNDFIVVEYTFENTGIVDINGDGNVNHTDNVIDAFTLNTQALPLMTVELSDAGGRRGNRFGASRMVGYVADEDETGAPWDMLVTYAGPSEAKLDVWDLPEQDRHFGVIDPASRGYMDIWGGWTWLGVKQGADASFNAPDKETIFGTHPIGEGPERGWYTSNPFGHFGFYSNGIPWRTFAASTAQWFENYGRTKVWDDHDLNPNSRFFESGVEGDVTTFVPKATPERPHGDTKYASIDVGLQQGFHQKPFENGWTKGWNQHEPCCTGIMVSGVGPFRLEVGETITVVFVEYAGYRLPGLKNALRSARWAWERDWDIQNDLPVPATPQMSVEATPNETALIRWNNVADADADGYKIWRSPQFKEIKFIDRGMRGVSNYWKQHNVNDDYKQYLDPINPNFGGMDYAQPEDRGLYNPGSWGTFELIAKIPKAELGQYQNASGEFHYAYEDEGAILGFTYWYYVSAYKEGSFTGPGGQTTTHLETSNFNRNGAVGLWQGTYPFATRSTAFPTTPEGRAKIGAAFTVVPPVANVDDLLAGRVKITVSPNPYKIASITDVRDDATSHDIDFLNLPANCTLTILDVSGQIIFQELIEAAPNGSWTWNMFSKDGIEVASGLYIYHVKYDGGEHLGHFAILR